MSKRDPFSFPRFENDCTLSGFRPQQWSFKKPTHIAQTEDPWSRLHSSATVASTQRSATHHKQLAPQDRLDFQLKSVYDQHKDIFWNKNQVLYQKETISDHGGSQEHKSGTRENKQGDIRVWVDPQRCSIYSMK